MEQLLEILEDIRPDVDFAAADQLVSGGKSRLGSDLLRINIKNLGNDCF